MTTNRVFRSLLGHREEDFKYSEPRLSFANTPMPSRRPEPDWTPSVLTDQDSNSSQEESGCELNDSETLAIYNDAMEKLSVASGLSSDEFEPLTSRLTTTWKNTSKSMQDESKERALQGCRVVCECESLRCTLREIEDNINNFDLTFYSEEQKEDLNHDFNCARSNILDWKSHVLRASNQERAKQDFLHDMKAGEEALVVMDWAMKFNQLKFREKQSEWFGKRGLSWHISSVIMKSKETKEIEVRSFAHLFDSCTQDWYAVVSIVEDLLVKMKLENPYLTKVYIRSDEAGCYHNNNLIAALRDVSKRTRVTIGRLDHSEPQHDKTYVTGFYVP
ncbi:hypothetical protein QZH41_005701 [Actinostola sp. cb2023]|nr:hypothetical protein QZH41_005701 [Actinostola sp. cb2023]